jgi:hypothetical protein
VQHCLVGSEMCIRDRFLAVQSSEAQSGFDGFWVLRDLPDA